MDKATDVEVACHMEFGGSVVEDILHKEAGHSALAEEDTWNIPSEVGDRILDAGSAGIRVVALADILK